MVFLYGLIKGREKINLETPGIDQAQVFAVSREDLHILASQCSDTFAHCDFPRETLVKSLIDYQKVMEGVLEREDIIPFKFGTVVRNEKEVLKLLESKHQTFQSLLNLYHDSREFSVMATWLNPKTIFDTLLKEDKELSDLKKKAETTQDSLDKIKVGQRLQVVLFAKNREIDALISRATKKISRDSTSHEKMDDFMIYHESHLIPKSDIPIFYECLEELNQALQKQWEHILLRTIGPLPVYSFATVFVQRIPRAELEKARSLLGVESSSSFAELQKAYTNLMGIIHPDVDPHHGVTKIEEVRSAYKLLSECYKYAKVFSGNEDYIGIEIKKAE